MMRLSRRIASPKKMKPTVRWAPSCHLENEVCRCAKELYALWCGMQADSETDSNVYLVDNFSELTYARKRVNYQLLSLWRR